MSLSLPDASVNKNLEGKSVRASVQRFGGFLAGMIMPNIGAFIAWGLITALFLSTGWLPNPTLAKLIDPMLTYLLPLLIGYTGGKMVHGTRGAVIGAIATMGVVVGASVPMFLGAMLMGPLAAWLLKKLDKVLDGHVRAGFEMLVDNFSLGILGMLLAIGGHLSIGPIVDTLMGWMASGVNVLVAHHLLPLASIFVEPAKVLFLNNAVNHGILTPLGIEGAKQTGRSILFMVESNPGPGFGLLLAYWAFGAKNIRDSVPGAVIIHLFGGIHEIFFPYVLMKPKTILATIAGAMSGLAVGSVLGAGLVGPASPGSIITWFVMTPRGGYLPMILDFLTATVVSFVVASLLIRPDKARDEAAVVAQESSGTQTAAGGEEGSHAGDAQIDASGVRTVVVACDAGMGSSVMVASVLKKKLSPYGVDVTHTSVEDIPADARLVLTQENLATRARRQAPKAHVVPFTNFTNDPAFDAVADAVRRAHEGVTEASDETSPASVAVVVDAERRATKKSLSADVLPRAGIRLGLTARDKDDAIRQAGQVLLDLGAIDEEYVGGMIDRESEVSTYMGEGFAIPHGTNRARAHVRTTALGFLQFPAGVEWNGKTCYVAIPIASRSDEHIGIMAKLATVLADKTKAEQLRTATTVDQVLTLLAPEGN